MDEPVKSPPSISRFSDDPSTRGFDQSAGAQWIYPENYPLRDYQFNIVKSALYHNTLVCLPTGLGKTFIAAVVMYNFWRWYPMGRIVFLAPTKPLVAQQINACHDIMGIPNEETIELTGSMDQKKRQVAWNNNAGARVIFATPQVFHNDLEKNIVPAELVKCVVVDEAHRALGKHSYCESVRILSEKNKFFRVLGLSATPGGKLDAVQDVIRNLYISRLELRDDTSPDIIPYINKRKLDIILVGLGEDLEKFKDRYIIIMDPHVRVLLQNNILRGNTSNLSKGRIFHINKEWHQRPKQGNNHGLITKTLMILLTMYHAYELMIRHGLRAFYNFYQKHEDKFWLSSEHALAELLEEINYYLGPFPDIPSILTESYPIIPEGIRFGHNKFYKLKEILLRHFENYRNKDEETRAIVFIEFRDIVNEVYVLLLQAMPLLRPQKFVGQAGQKRKEQSKALEDFRSNKANVLISTSVGEEGLDVGEVDLIVCFDTTQVNPTRLVQRMGRTGRKRDGHIIVLATNGKEHETLKSSMSRRDSLNNKVLHSSGILSALYLESPRMVPMDLQPECRKICVIAHPKVAGPSKRKGKTKEPKKPRKKAETNNKTKNTKNPVVSGSHSLMKFFKRTKEDFEMESDNEIVDLTMNNVPQSVSHALKVPQCNNSTVKLSNIKLLTSDDAAIEFLTLCTMKRSQNERANDGGRKTNPYFPSYYEKHEEINFNFEIPNLKILDCLETLEPYVEPITNYGNNEASIFHEDNEHFRPSGCFEDLYQNQNPQNDDNDLCDLKFEALLDDSSSDSDKTRIEPLEDDKHDYPIDETVDWGESVSEFQLDLDEWSDEMRMTPVKNGWNDDDAPEPTTASRSPDKSTENLKNVVESSLKMKATEKSTVEPVRMEDNADGEFSVFEQLLNHDSETNSEDNKANSVEDGTSNDLIDKSGAFEDLLNEDSETSCEQNKSNPVDNETCNDLVEKSQAFEDLLNEDSETSCEQNKSNPVDNETCNDLVEKSQAFEDLLNEDSETSCEQNKSNPVDNETCNDLVEKSQAFEDFLNDEWETSSEKCDSDATVDGLGETNVFDNLPDDDSSTKSGLNNFQEKNVALIENEEIEVNSKEKPEEFARILDSLSDDSETQFDGEFSVNKKNSQVSSTKSTKHIRYSHDEIADSIENRDKLIPSRGASEKSHDDSIDLLDGFESRNSQNSNCEKRHFGVISEILTNSRSSAFKNSTPKTSKQELPGVALLTHHETSERTSATSNIVNIDTQGHEMSRSFDGESENSRFRENDNSCDRQCTSKVNVEEASESDVDIFGADDLLVDSDFEEQINEIEKSAGSNTSALKKDAIFENYLDKSGENVVVEKPENIGVNGDNESEQIPEIEIPENPKINANDRSEKSVDSGVLTSAGKSEKIAEQSIPEDAKIWPKRDIVPRNSTESANSSVRLAASDFDLDDCDWDPIDFEIPVVDSRAPRNDKNIVRGAGSKSTWIDRPESESSEVKNSGHSPKATGWLSTEKPKPRLSLSKKLSRNICNSFWKGSRNERESGKRDSDSENDFTVLRLETKFSKNFDDDCFSKPRPVSAIKKPEISTTMSKSVRSVRGPLSLKRFDVNKIEETKFSRFAAPPKYREKETSHGTSGVKTLGIGEPRSLSCNLDNRKRKKVQMHSSAAKRLRPKNAFIDDEAEVSTDGELSSGSSGCDDDLDGFVSYTQNVDDSVDMQAHYLQTVRSPVNARGFHFKKSKDPNPDLQIYSQPLLDEPNHYINDSFCVDEEDEVFEECVTSDELTRLEKLETELKRKKRKRTESAESRAKRKRKVLASTHDTTSSEDETENLRRQIQEESFTLKNR
ncbi:uncharacterized protein Fancm [Venturia canescens]|uniref:uncharacterized protein Fancm n=1 Tax=Venturia canescens TaxID=32260 RepID=UPI001C9D3859|nr:uncharacterized protein LOC122415616 [Venturia canescens]XP_043283832.1 uncharacterized protein LOC122415616 [Venturia canescens]